MKLYLPGALYDRLASMGHDVSSFERAPTAKELEVETRKARIAEYRHAEFLASQRDLVKPSKPGKAARKAKLKRLQLQAFGGDA